MLDILIKKDILVVTVDDGTAGRVAKNPESQTTRIKKEQASEIQS